jgi:hypothetical protein
MAKRFLSVLILAILSLGYLSVGVQPAGSRRIACIDPVADTNVLPLSGKLFGEIQDEALRKSTMDYYLFLTKVELQALDGRRSIRAMYGLKDGAPSAMPTVSNFSLSGNVFASGFLWGQMGDIKPQPRVLPGLAIPPYTLGYSAAEAEASPAKTARGILFPPYNQPSVSQSVAASPTAGAFFPATNRANPKIGTF